MQGHTGCGSLSLAAFRACVCRESEQRRSKSTLVPPQCDVDFELTHENKGFESIQYLTTSEGAGVLLGLCEGNYCEGGRRGREPGNGRVVVSALRSAADGGCVWAPQKTLEVPASASFQDYSALALNYGTGKVAILSQEDAAVWVRCRRLLGRGGAARACVCLSVQRCINK